MKFGKNLVHLSIPEWKSYNLDYNDLKSQIRQLTQLNSSTPPSSHALSPLYQSFTENFDYINLFIDTKYGELQRKLKYFEAEFNKTMQSPEDSNIEKFLKLNEVYYKIVIEVSLVLKKLIKFILIQKIAVKKIFKKFLKYSVFSDSVSNKFVNNLKYYLNSNNRSFFKIDLSSLTLELTNLINLVKLNQKELNSLIKKGGSELISNSMSSENTPLDMDINAVNFDLLAILKKNFTLDFLIPNDPNTTNELLINLDIYINLKFLNQSTISFIFLTDPDCFKDDSGHQPSYIISQSNANYSILIAHTGGLRNFSHCILSNEIVSPFLSYLIDSNNKSLETKLKNLLKPFLTPLTKLTIDTIVNRQLKPSTKLICKRSRYFMGKFDETIDEEDDANDSNSVVSSHTNGDAVSSHSKVKKVYEDDYLISFDQDICTTNNPSNFNLSFDTGEDYDRFPFNHLTLHSNDSNLHNFETNLSTVISEGSNELKINYRLTYLNKLPTKIQQLIKNNFSLNLFKNLSFFEYLKSCYFNKIPSEKYHNNHFLILLNLNLYKNLENLVSANNQLNLDDEIISNQSSQFLRRQSSFKSISSHYNEMVENQQRSILSQNTNYNKHSISTANSLYMASMNSLNELNLIDDLRNYQNYYGIIDGNDDDYYYSDNYLIYLKVNEPHFNTSSLNNLIISFIKFKIKLRKLLDSNFNLPLAMFQRSGSTSSSIKFEKKALIHPKQQYQEDLEYYYDSINDDTNYLSSKVNDYQVKFEEDYDNTLSIFNYALFFVSLFITSIELGIVYSILKIQQENTKFNVSDNIWLILIILLGLLLSLILSMISIVINFQRINHSSRFHTMTLWFGFLVVVVSLIWTLDVFLEPS